MSSVDVAGVTVVELTPEEGRAVFDEQTRAELGVSGTDFLAAYQAGRLPSDWSAESVCRLEMLLPFTR